jgi:hypothetical protein
MNTPNIPSPTVRSRDTEPAFRLAARTAGLRPSAIREILKVTESPGGPFWVGAPRNNTLCLNSS